MTSTALYEERDTRCDHLEPKATYHDEMWNGVPYMPPMPNIVHQSVKSELWAFLRQNWARPTGGKAYTEVNLVHPDDEDDWTNNFRVPDSVLLSEDRRHFDKFKYICGAPLVVIEIRSMGDRSYEKLEYYAELGVPETWIIDRSSRHPEVHVLTDGVYELQGPDADGWVTSPATGVQFRKTDEGKLRVRMRDNDSTAIETPED